MATRNAIIVIGIAILLSAIFTEQNEIEFTYSGEKGPEKWGGLSPSFETCSKGKHQSPIDIVKDDAVYNPNLQSLIRDYNPTNATLINYGVGIGLLYKDGVGVAIVDGKNYTLKQMHWRSPSEHTIDGVRYPLELHLVHVADDGSVSMVSIIYQYGNPDPLISRLKNSLDRLSEDVCKDDEEAHVPVTFLGTNNLKRGTTKYFRYLGSLTVPPCTENVIWHILGKVREISKEQVETLRAPLGITNKNNSRPIQPLNDRKVELYDVQHKC